MPASTTCLTRCSASTQPRAGRCGGSSTAGEHAVWGRFAVGCGGRGSSWLRLRHCCGASVSVCSGLCRAQTYAAGCHSCELLHFVAAQMLPQEGQPSQEDAALRWGEGWNDPAPASSSSAGADSAEGGQPSSTSSSAGSSSSGEQQRPAGLGLADAAGRRDAEAEAEATAPTSCDSPAWGAYVLQSGLQVRAGIRGGGSHSFLEQRGAGAGRRRQ